MAAITIIPVASFTQEVDWHLAKHPLVFNGRLANRQLASIVKEATGTNELKQGNKYLASLKRNAGFH